MTSYARSRKRYGSFTASAKQELFSTMLTAFGRKPIKHPRLRRYLEVSTGKKRTMAQPKRGEVWLADLGLAAKVRPVLVVSIPYSDADYALVCVIPWTTTPRGSQFEVNIQVPGLQPGSLN